MRRRGIDDLTIIERSDGVGGTWRRNVYPGAACDIQSHLYSFSFAPNRAWSRTYAYQPEILDYLETVADDFDLRRHLMLNTGVRSMEWNAQASNWHVNLTSGGVVVADVVVSAVGLFGSVRYPDIDGLADFAGTLMHTAHWDRTVDLSGKRVAVIGTGASGVQVVPELADVAAELTVFQRTPPWMVPKEDRPYSAAELSNYRRLPWASWRERWRLWKLQHDNTALTPDHPRMAVVEKLSRGFLRKHVADDRLRDALTPRYPFRCKRVLLGEKYYTALQRDHVDLVTEPIVQITESGIITADGTAIDVDASCLRRDSKPATTSPGIDVIGVDGESLHERWGCDPQAYLGTAVSGFPNFFMLYGPNTNQGANSIIYILEAGARLIASAVEQVSAPRRLHRRPSRRRAPVQRTDLRRTGADDLDAMRQLLPIAVRPHRHPMAAFGTRLRESDMAGAVTRLDSQWPRRVAASPSLLRDGDCAQFRDLFADSRGVSGVWDNRRW